jgi:hypothetical protein
MTTNRASERVVERLDQAGVANAVKARESQGSDDYRQQSIDILSARNPERVFRIKMPFDSPPGFELNRELHKVGAGHSLDRGKLLAK